MKSVTDKIIGLNLGARNRSIPDFLNMDIDQHAGVDIVGDVSDLSRFKNNSIPAIYASHILEHMGHNVTLSVLKEWNRVIEPNGKLYVAVPDFERVVEIYKQIGGLHDWVIRYLMGDQLYKTAYHYDLFDERRMNSLLRQAGFTELHRMDSFPIGDPNDCSNGKSTLDGGSVSLNIMAIK